MSAKIKVLPIWTRAKSPRPKGSTVVSTVSKSQTAWERDLSPFTLGPCKLYDNFISKTMENGWQYAKVYKEFLDARNRVTDEYWDWAIAGWSNPRAVRYPVGKGRKPLYSLWEDEHLGYVDARKEIYVPLYARAVQMTEGWERLVKLFETEKQLVLLDFDAYDHAAKGMTLTEVLNDPTRKMGHAFVLMMLLTDDKALKQCAI